MSFLQLCLLVDWAYLSRVFAYGKGGWADVLLFVFLLWIFWSDLDAKPISVPKGPIVHGQEDRTGLICLVCPHCSIEEWRIHDGENYCEITGEPFYLIAFPYKERR